MRRRSRDQKTEGNDLARVTLRRVSELLRPFQLHATNILALNRSYLRPWAESNLKIYYAVRKGKTTGLFTTWAECQKSVSGFAGASFKGFETREEAQIFLGTGDVLNPEKFYGIAKGRTPGVYSSWARAEEQVSGWHNAVYRGFPTIEAAQKFVAQERGIDCSEVFVAQSHFDQFKGYLNKSTGVKFEPVDDLPFLEQFDTLASSQDWLPGSQEYRDQRNKAIKEEFHLTALQGINLKEEGLDPQELDKRRMEGYRNLCRRLGKSEPNSRDEAREILQAKPWVNIIDLIDGARTGKPVRVWWDFTEFRTYTNISKKWIDLGYAKEDEFLSALLVHFRDPERNRFHNQGKWTKPFQSNSRVLSGSIRKRNQSVQSKLTLDIAHIKEVQHQQPEVVPKLEPQES